MKHQLFIPKKIKVGYQKREDTYTKKLAYIIYYDNKGILRKQTSWEGWRHKDIEPEEFDNTPQGGLVLNKDINRYNWGHFSSHRTMIRVYDPRGIEFEITTENLIGVLMNSDCSKRGLSGEFVYAWYGPELVLLPTNCEEYEAATKFTTLQSSKISAKTLIPGAIYKTKRQENVIYIGKYMWYEFNWYNQLQKSREGKMKYIFTSAKPAGLPNPDKFTYIFDAKSSIAFLGEQLTSEAVTEYASIVDELQTNPHLTDIAEFKLTPTTCNFDIENNPASHSQSFNKKAFYKLSGDILTEYYIQIDKQWNRTWVPGENSTPNYQIKGYSTYPYHSFNIKTKSAIEKDHHNLRHYFTTLKELKDFEFCDLKVIFSNGKQKTLDSLSNLQ